MPNQIESTSNVFRQANYNSPGSGTPAQKTFTKPVDYLLIANTDSTHYITLSFDGGNTYITLNANTSLEIWPCKMTSYYVSDDGSHAVAVQTLAGSEL